MPLHLKTLSLLCALVLSTSNCGHWNFEPARHKAFTETRKVSVITLGYGLNEKFEEAYFADFARQRGVKVDLAPPTETVKSRLGMYEELFKRHSAEPDLYEIDVIWPPAIADDFIDLTPYFEREIPEFDPGVIKSFTVRGRLIALPTFVDMGVLYYRPDLLKKYGYAQPPSTWDQMEHMAAVIQRGERQRGKRDFWGYAWQGGANEALTCNALEWQTSAGDQPFVAGDGTIHVRDSAMITALKRARSWIGTLSPPGEAFYREMDAMNLWNEGEAAFMRNWVSSYGVSKSYVGEDATHFRLAPLPGGPGGQRSTLGGLGMGVSKYSKSVDLAIEALRGLTSEPSELRRALEAGTIPTRISLQNNANLMARTALPGTLAGQVMRNLVPRPSGPFGDAYDAASRAYYKAVNSVLNKQASPEIAMANLEMQLAQLKRVRTPF